MVTSRREFTIRTNLRNSVFWRVGINGYKQGLQSKPMWPFVSLHDQFQSSAINLLFWLKVMWSCLQRWPPTVSFKKIWTSGYFIIFCLLIWLLSLHRCGQLFVWLIIFAFKKIKHRKTILFVYQYVVILGSCLIIARKKREGGDNKQKKKNKQ